MKKNISIRNSTVLVLFIGIIVLGIYMLTLYYGGIVPYKVDNSNESNISMNLKPEQHQHLQGIHLITRACILMPMR